MLSCTALLAAGCRGDGSDTGTQGGDVFPAGFEWGVATSAFQVEGGAENDYTRWIALGGAPDIGLACDSWNRWEEDADLAVELGVDRYRLSLEWARLEPEEGTFDWDAYERIVEENEVTRELTERWDRPELH